MADFKEQQSVKRRVTDTKTGAVAFTAPVSAQSLSVTGNERTFSSEQDDAIITQDGTLQPTGTPDLAACRTCEKGLFYKDAIARCGTDGKSPSATPGCCTITCKRCGTFHGGMWLCHRCNRNRLWRAFFGLFKFWMVLLVFGGVLMIDERDFQKLKYQFETLRLAQFAPALRDQLSWLRPESDNPADAMLWPHLVEEFKALAGDVETTGLINVPPSFFPSGFPVALQEKTDAVVNVSDGGNCVATGPPGCGKTTFLQNVMLAVKARGGKLFIIDPKKDHEFLPAIFPGFVTIDGSTKVNLLSRPAWRSVEEHVMEQVGLFQANNYSGEQQGAVLRKAMTLAFTDRPNPSWQDVHDIVDKMSSNKDTYNVRDACLGVSERLHRLKQRYGVPYATREGMPLAAVLDHDVLFPMESLDLVGAWQASSLLNHVFQRNKHYGIRHLTTGAFIDEGIGVVSKASAASKITGTSPLATLATMNREFGLWMCFSTVDLVETDPLILSAATIALLPGVHERGLRLAGLTPLQAQTARHMRLGQVLLLYPGRLSWPLMARFSQLPEGLKERRPAAVAPVSQPPEIVDVGLRAPDKSPIVFMASGPDAPSPAPIAPVVREVLDVPATVVPVEPAVDPRPAGEAVLDSVRLGFLRHVGEEVVAITTPTYKAVGVHYERGNQIKQEMIGLGYLVDGPLTTSGGRGGSRARGLTLTSAGYRRIGVSPGPRSVGCGLQHAYLAQQYLQLIRNSRLEIDIAGKRPDLVVRIDYVVHKAFLAALDAQSISWLGRPYSLPDGALVALEIETGDASNIKRSLANNLKDRSMAGLEWIVFASMPATFEKALAFVRADGDPKLLVVDAIVLLDSLRAGRGAKDQEGKEEPQ